MPFDAICTSCGETVAVADEHRGWTVRCPVCLSPFLAGDAPPRVLKVPAGERPYILTRAEEVDDDEDDSDLSLEVDRDAALSAVAAPATFLEIITWLHLVACGLLAAGFVLAALDANQNAAGDELDVLMMGLVGSMISLVYFAVIAYGARKMKTLSSYSWAVAAGVMACVGLAICICGLFMAAAGIWALAVVNRPEVRGAFDDQARWQPPGQNR